MVGEHDRRPSMHACRRLGRLLGRAGLFTATVEVTLCRRVCLGPPRRLSEWRPEMGSNATLRAYVAPDTPTQAVAVSAARAADTGGRHSRVIAVAVSAVTLAGFGAALVAIVRSPSTVSTVSPTSTTVDIALERRLIAESAANLESGAWVPYHGSPGVPGVVVPYGWAKPGPGMDGIRRSAQDGIPIYDRPDGVVVGYEFASLGYVPRSVAEEPSFDPHAARVSRFGCDPTRDCPGTR